MSPRPELSPIERCRAALVNGAAAGLFLAAAVAHMLGPEPKGLSVPIRLAGAYAAQRNLGLLSAHRPPDSPEADRALLVARLRGPTWLFLAAVLLAFDLGRLLDSG